MSATLLAGAALAPATGGLSLLGSIGIQAGLTGLAGGISGLISGSAERKAAREVNRKIDKALARVDDQRDKSRRQFSNTAQSFLTNYALVRDPQKSEGIRASYSQERQGQDTRENRLDDMTMQLEASRPTAGGSDLGDFAGGFGIGAAQGAASGIGQAIGSGAFDNNTLGDNTGSSDVSGIKLGSDANGNISNVGSNSFTTPALDFKYGSNDMNGIGTNFLNNNSNTQSNVTGFKIPTELKLNSDISGLYKSPSNDSFLQGLDKSNPFGSTIKDAYPASQSPQFKLQENPFDDYKTRRIQWH